MTGRGSVLVVEDQGDLLALVADVLASEGYEVWTAEDGLAALAVIASRGVPDLILLDMRMPRMNGWDFARELARRYPVHPPLIVMTAAVDAREYAARVSAVDCLEKPFEIEALIASVQRFIKPAAAPGA